MPAVPNSILDDVKKMLGLGVGYTAFDTDVIIHINSTFSTLHQLGIGTVDPFEIVDNTATWSQFLGANKLINSAKTYMFLKVRMYFDPPATSFSQTAMNEQIRELEWRLNAAADKVYTELPPLEPEEPEEPDEDE